MADGVKRADVTGNTDTAEADMAAADAIVALLKILAKTANFEAAEASKPKLRIRP